MRLADYALWLDLETTGLSEFADRVLEVGWVLTRVEPGFPEVAWGEERILDTPYLVLERLIRDDVVREMHTANGLLGELRTDGGVPSAVADGRIVDAILAHAGTRPVALAGSGVAHFDRRFLAVYLPRLHHRLTHYALDVGVVRRFRAIAGIDPVYPGAKAHRALADALAALDEARRYTAELVPAGGAR